MIIHKITHPDNKYVPPPVPYPNSNGYLWNRKKMNKLEMSQYIEGMGFKVGDFVVRDSAVKPYADQDVLRVYYIEENVNSVKDTDWNNDGKPMCFYLETVSGKDSRSFPWKTCGDWLKPVDHKHLPPKWVQIVQQEELAAEQGKGAQ